MRYRNDKWCILLRVDDVIDGDARRNRYAFYFYHQFFNALDSQIPSRDIPSKRELSSGRQGFAGYGIERSLDIGTCQETLRNFKNERVNTSTAIIDIELALIMNHIMNDGVVTRSCINTIGSRAASECILARTTEQTVVSRTTIERICTKKTKQEIISCATI
ncbi:hypothetical protein Lery_1160 [Legionella erythra]|uniref:Uncharacterized protein n=1 Tax=Legionella erythra TaxID=448 RepID=A0A0W0TRS2_LEGER|nr:hypothetical protein Lery_1160 [Legionella erythra]